MNKYQIAGLFILAVIALCLPVPLINLLPPGQLIENRLIDKKVQQVKLPEYVKINDKDCSYNDPVDVGPGCTYKYTSTGAMGKKLETEVKAAFSATGYDVGDVEDDDLVAKGKGIRVDI